MCSTKNDCRDGSRIIPLLRGGKKSIFPPFHPLESLWQLIRIYLFNESWNLNFPNWTFLNFSNHCCGICKPCISTSTYGRKTLGQFYCWQFALHLHLFQALFRNPEASGCCCSTITRIPNITSQNNGGKCAVSKNSVCESKYYRGEEGKRRQIII